MMDHDFGPTPIYFDHYVGKDPAAEPAPRTDTVKKDRKKAGRAYVEQCVRRIAIFCDNRGIDYRVINSKRTASKYVVVSLGDEPYRVRVSDHPPKSVAYDATVHMGQGGKNIQEVMGKIKHMWKESAK